MPYKIEDLMSKESEREKQKQPEPSPIAPMVTKEKVAKQPKVKVKVAKKDKPQVELTPLQQKTMDYASVFLTVLLGTLLLAGAIRLIMWMFGA